MDEHLQQPTDLNDLINLLLQGGLGEGLPRIAEILMNAAMLVERTKHLGAGPYERVEARCVNLPVPLRDALRALRSLCALCAMVPLRDG